MLNSLLQPLKDFYNEREDRERFLLVFGVPIILVLLSYQFIWKPIYENHQRQQQFLNQQQQFRLWFMNQKSRLSGDINSNLFDWNNQSLPSIVEQSLRKKNLTPWKKRIYQNGKQQTVVSFGAIPYTQLSDWIVMLHKDYQIVVIEAVLTAVEKKGYVDSSIIMEKPPQ